jgi:glycosyltransferase involved in cell wall biosynthesis
MTSVLTVFGGYPGSPVTGAARMAWRTTAALAERGHEVAVLTDTLRPDDLAGARWPVFRSAVSFQASGARHPDVVHVYDVASAGHARLGYELAMKLGAELLLTPASALVTWPDRDLGRRLCAAASAVFTLSGVEARQIESLGVPGGRVSRIPQAPDLTGVGDGGAFRARHAMAGRVVLFLGRRVQSKGYGLLLEAAPRVWESRPGTVFAFGGADGDAEAAHAFAGHRDARILDLGRLTDSAKHDALAACDLLCLPSAADVFPLVFPEAWSCGKPVISGPFDGADEVVRDGVDGLVCELTAADVAATVLRLVVDAPLRQRLGAAGRERVNNGMTWSHVAGAVESRFPAGAAGPRRRPLEESR